LVSVVAVIAGVEIVDAFDIVVEVIVVVIDVVLVESNIIASSYCDGS